MKQNTRQTSSLWTRDFTIITAGSAVSMFGNALSGFAMSLMVLDISHSTLLYAVYIAMYTLPMLFVPIISGAVLDRYSRKKTIYTLDFLSSGLYLLIALLIAKGWFSFPVFAAFCFILGSIESVYLVAYESFYPLLITEGNLQKAYSVASVLETVSAVMVPVSAFLYHQIGLAPLLAVNALCFFAAAVMETRIRTEEQYIETQKETA
ncbi:MAG: MFS transporter, partial [Mogibacterium sp.]|nr:MFS transporter [Mogibacterium sp.]